MEIWISPDALTDPVHSQLPWPGLLYGLYRLQESGHKLGTNEESLSDDISSLLEQDKIQLNAASRDEADLVIQTREHQLIYEDPEQSTDVRADTWHRLSHSILFPRRTAAVSRNTAETEISLKLNIDGSGKSSIATGLGFFDHMLEQIARHGVMDLELTCNGDLDVDEHHTIEDVAIALGEAIREALGDKKGIQRYSFVLPMDESRSTVSLDFSGRPYFEFEGNFQREYVGDFPTEMVDHFFQSLAVNMKATLHMIVSGQNDHHKIEACFKGMALTLRASATRSERMLNIIPSSKGTL